MSRRYTRRTFLGGISTAAGAGLVPSELWAVSSGKSPNETPNIAAVGVGGKGWADLNGAAKHGNIVAFCDVETGKVGRRGGFNAAARQWPKARRYTDWRVMLEKEKNLDGITVSTPDHMHAPITMTALKMGIGCYTQKPLTRTIHESRAITLAAREAKVATQMGNQNHSGRTYRTLVNLVKTGVIGKIKRVHAWSNRPIWPQGIQRPAIIAEAPSSLAWDLWLGVAPDRAFAPEAYHPFKWRGWHDFGAGALGDMGCHIIDPVYWALGLDAPTKVSYEGPPPMKETFPTWERIHYQFPGTDFTTNETIDVTWHDGKKKPEPAECDLPADTKIPDNGVIFIGEKGVLVTAHGSQSLPKLYPEKDFKDYEMKIIPTTDHYEQWVNAITGIGTPSSNFDYAGPLCETVLLGCVASQIPEIKLEWDSKALKFKNSKAANALIRQEYRQGWEVEEL